MSLLARRIRGFRLIDLVGLSILVLLIVGVYLAKTIAGRERAEIASAERQIEAERARIRLLQAEVTHLEQPARIERLAQTYLGMAPVSIKHEANPDILGEVAIHPTAPSPKADAAPPAIEAAAR
jgi:cell division protein FtsL